MTYLGLDIARAEHLADLVARWPADVDDVQHTVSVAESLADLSAGIAGNLAEISATGQLIASALRRAIDAATSFHIDPRLALFLDRPVGSTYAPPTAEQALAAGETYKQTELRHDIEVLTSHLSHVPPGRRRELQEQIAVFRAAYQAIDPPGHGDRGGTLTAEVRTPFSPLGTTPFTLGAGIIAHALADTGDDEQVQVDEFQVIFHENGKVTLVLPGVVDLSSPDYGLDDVHRSARDVDQYALPSSFNSRISSNVYAQLIVQWLEAQVTNGVIPAGTDVMIVGHSFGADTALDLAADPHVNGELVNITHVIPAAYHSEPQLDDVVNGTQVGVLQNIYDLPVLVEGLGGDITGVVGTVLGPLVGVEPMGGEGVPGQGFIAEFEGGFEGVGHHQNNYIDYVESDGLPEVVVTMLTDIGRAGYGSPGITLAVDISVPVQAAPEPEPSRAPSPVPLPEVSPINPVTVFEPVVGPFSPLIEPFEDVLVRPNN